LIDVREASMRTTLFGTTWESPIFICPCGYHKAFHPQGELATARAARARKSLMLLSTVTTTPVEDVNREYGTSVWYQLYATSSWTVTERLVKRAEAAGCPVLVWTIDLMAGRNTETQTRFRRLDTRECATCHGPAGPGRGTLARYPMFAGIDVTGVGLAAPALNWDTVERLKKLTSMKVVLKGIETREDAELACQHGADGIIVSNHGGRAEESGRGTIQCLPEVVEAAQGRVPVMIDGGVRRGADVFKALALGAKAVGIGRPYLWGSPRSDSPESSASWSFCGRNSASSCGSAASRASKKSRELRSSRRKRRASRYTVR
jgi:isopentenyl diphosphate isomerase/L-lactate dehydrogenase-like FMN-dependent dehydrogenase